MKRTGTCVLSPRRCAPGGASTTRGCPEYKPSVVTSSRDERFALLYDLGCAFSARIDLQELVPFVIARCRDLLGPWYGATGRLPMAEDAAAAAAWAATTLVIRRSSLSEAPPVQTLCYQLAIAGLLLLPATALLGDLGRIQMTEAVVASLAFQTLVISLAALLLWFALLRRYFASQLGVFSLLSPVFGVLFGALLLGEPLTINFVVGGAVLLVGLLTVTR